MTPPQPNTDPAAAAIAAYLRAGFSVIPVGDDKRPSLILPGRQWATYQRRRATPQEWIGWWNKGVRSPGIVCGLLSGVYGLDGDDPEFNDWLLNSGDANGLLGSTWVALTACDGPHVYLGSEIPVTSQILKSGNRKVADIRGDGQGNAGPSYLVAPPTHSICPKHHIEGNYRTLYGSPEKILRVHDALKVFQFLAQAFDRRTAPKTISIPTNGHIGPEEFQPPPPDDSGRWDESQGAVTATSSDIPLPLSAEAKASLEKRVRDSRLSRKIKRALLQGVVAGVGDWVEVGDDNSAVDFALTCALLRQSFSETETLQCFTTLHAGDFTFKNPKRPQHGLRYFYDYTWKAAQQAAAESKVAEAAAAGLNFIVTEHIIIPFDEVPSYVTTLKTTSGQEVKVKFKIADFESDASFCRAVWRQSTPQFMPSLQTGHLGRVGFRAFMDALGRMGKVEDDLPEGASESGYLQTVILNTIKGANLRFTSSDPQESSLGWLQGAWVIIRSDVLISRVRGALGRVTVREIWLAFEKLGGQAEQLRVANREENVWILAADKVIDDDE